MRMGSAATIQIRWATVKAHEAERTVSFDEWATGQYVNVLQYREGERGPDGMTWGEWRIVPLEVAG